MEPNLLVALSSWRNLLQALPALTMPEVLEALAFEAESRRRQEIMRALVRRAARLQADEMMKSLMEMHNMHVPSKILEDEPKPEPKKEPAKRKTGKKPAKKKK